MLRFSQGTLSLPGRFRVSSPTFTASLFLAAAALVYPLRFAVAQSVQPELSAAAGSETAAHVVRWAGTLPEAAGKTIEVRFALYENAAGGLALWSESQPVLVGADGRYSVLLGATSSEGLPQTLFPTGQSRWVEARVVNTPGKAEPEVAVAPRSLLAAVPYAFKSVDAETLAGRAAADYLTREDLQQSVQSAILAVPVQTPVGVNPEATPAIAGTGTTNSLALWTNSTTLATSLVTQVGTNVGVNTTAPATTLDVNGNTTIRGSIILPANGNATASVGTSSHSVQFGSSTYSSATAEPVPQTFKFQSFPVGNNTASPSANLELLFGIGSNTPIATGFSFASNGRITFAPGQIFPGTGAGTITKIVTTTPLTGGATSGTATLGLSTSALETTLNPVYARLAAANNFTSTLSTKGSIGIGTTGPDAPLDIEAPSVGQALLISAGGPDSWALNSFGGSGSDGLAGRFIAGTGGGGIAVGGGSTDDSTIGGLGASISGGYSYEGEGGDGVDVYAGNLDYGTREGYAGQFSGDVKVTGNIFGGAKYFQVDHPTDPTNKYLNHVSTESSEMMNIYSGNVTTDEKGLTTVHLPAWFETINTDFRYQLTVVGQFAQAIVKSKIANGQFTIMTSVPNVEVSWMITALRNDRYALAHPLVVEQAKPANERGFYIHPELYGQPATRQSEWGRHPRQMLAQQQARKGRASNRPLAPIAPLPDSLTQKIK